MQMSSIWNPEVFEMGCATNTASLALVKRYALCNQSGLGELHRDYHSQGTKKSIVELIESQASMWP
jgi:hypothetical protein